MLIPGSHIASGRWMRFGVGLILGWDKAAHLYGSECCDLSV